MKMKFFLLILCQLCFPFSTQFWIVASSRAVTSTSFEENNCKEGCAVVQAAVSPFSFFFFFYFFLQKFLLWGQELNRGWFPPPRPRTPFLLFFFFLYIYIKQCAVCAAPISMWCETHLHDCISRWWVLRFSTERYSLFFFCISRRSFS